MTMSEMGCITEDDRKLGRELKELLDRGDWEAIDKILDSLQPFVFTETPQEALARGRHAGIHIGFLNRVAPAVRTRRSFVALIGRWQEGIDRLPLPGLKAEDLLGIAPLES